MSNSDKSFCKLRSWELRAAEKFPPIDFSSDGEYDEISSADLLVKEPKLSVIVTAYNHGKYLVKNLESIVGQVTQYPYEVIVGDDCSTDNSLEIALDFQRRYPEKIRVLKARVNLNRGSSNFSRCFKSARASLVSYCEGDDFWIDNDKIERQVSFMIGHPAVQWLGSRCRSVDSTVNPPVETIFPPAALCGRLCKLDTMSFVFVHVSTWCIRKKFATQVHEVCSAVNLYSDSFVLIAAESLSGIYVMPEVVSVYRYSGNGAWSSLGEDGRCATRFRSLMNKEMYFPAKIARYCRAETTYEYYRFSRMFLKRRDYLNAAWAAFRFFERLVIYPRSIVHLSRLFTRAK